jgi:1-acyl-sn-glycerol-3-phosphate acyltransferase
LGIEIDFLRGQFALARALGRPLLPIALTGAHRVWEHPYTPRLRYGQRMSLRVLPPIPAVVTQTLSDDDLRESVQRQLKTVALSGDLTPPRRFVPAREGYWGGYAYRIDPAFPDLAAEIAARRQKD